MKVDANSVEEPRIVLSPDVLARGVSRKFRKGETLFHKGDSSRHLIYVSGGILGLVNLAPNGHESLLRVLGQHCFLGYRSFLVNEPYHATAISLSEGELLVFSYADAEELQRKSPALFLHLTRTLATDLRLAEERLNDISGKRVASRIIETLIFLKQKHPHYQWTRREIGEFCGAKTETVTRALTQLEKKGLIHKEGRDIHLNDINALLKLAQEERPVD